LAVADQKRQSWAFDNPANLAKTTEWPRCTQSWANFYRALDAPPGLLMSSFPRKKTSGFRLRSESLRDIAALIRTLRNEIIEA